MGNTHSLLDSFGTAVPIECPRDNEEREVKTAPNRGVVTE